MHNPFGTFGSYGGWGGKPRSEVEVILDGRSNKFDAKAWFLHKLNESKQGGRASGCGCTGGCARCWTPATAWFDYHRASVSFWKDIWDSLYGRAGSSPPGWPPGWPPGGGPSPCPPTDNANAGKLVMTIKVGAKARATFQVVNPTLDTVQLEFSVDGFWDSGSNKRWVSVTADQNQTILAPGDARAINVDVDLASTKVAADTYNGTILVKTPFTKRIDLEVQVS